MVTSDPITEPSDKGRCLFALGVNQSRALPRDGQILRIIMGCACVCVGTQEFVLITGDKLELTPGAGEARISSMMQRPVIYQLN
jgi:hypothetical protein